METLGLTLVGVIHLVLVVWMLWDLFSSERSCCGVGCWIWILMVFPVAGPIIYLIFFRSPKSYHD